MFPRKQWKLLGEYCSGTSRGVVEASMKVVEASVEAMKLLWNSMYFHEKGLLLRGTIVNRTKYR